MAIIKDDNGDDDGEEEEERKRAPPHMPIALVFTAFHRLQRPKTSVAPVFAASGFARFRKWRTHRYLHGFLCFLWLKGHKIWPQDMALSDKDSSLICSLILEKCCKLQHIALHRNLFMLCFRCFYTCFAGFSVLSMCEVQGRLFDL